MENVMSKTNDTSKPTTLEDHRPLADSKLDAVSGGRQKKIPIKMSYRKIELGLSHSTGSL
jgi:hypothetical protein